MNGLNNGLKKTCLLAFLLVLFAVSPVFGAETALSTGDISGTEQVTAGISYLEITPVSADVLIEDTVQLTAAAYDSEGQETSCTGLIWESSDETVGTVDSAGLFTALSPGTSTVTVFCGELNSGCNITVSEAETESVTETESESESGNPEDVSPEEESPDNLSELFPVEVSPSESELIIGDEQLFTASAFNESGSEVADAEFTWAVSDETIGTVDSTGLFTALAEGTVNVTATAGDFSADAAVTVSGAEIPEATSEATPEATLVPTPEPTAEAKTITEVISSISVDDAFGGVIPGVNDVYLKVANDYGARFDDFGNDTFHVFWTGGGLNALHIAESPGGYGEVTNTNAMSGTFYATETGGKGYHDAVYLCVAVNGTIPDDFSIHITSEGCQWVPGLLNETEYVSSATDEWFDKDDLIYGPQTWKPAAHIQYPIYPGQDVSDTSNTFRMMFIDLNGGTIDSQALKVQYEIENLNTMAAFALYGYRNYDDGYYNATGFTNRLTTTPDEYSGWYVSGAPLPDAASVVISPASADVPVNGKKQFTATAYDSGGSEIKGSPITWSSSNTGVGAIDSDGLFTPVSEGSTDITATAASGVSQAASVSVTSAVEKVLTTIDLDPSEVVMYTDQISSQKFNATGYDQFGDSIIPVLFTWSSSNPSVGTVDGNGLFTGLAEGTTTIKAENGSISQNATVEIKQHPDWDVSLIGHINRTLNRTDIIGLSSGGLMSYTDNQEFFCEGVNLTFILGLFDDDAPLTFNTELADLDYNVTIKGQASGINKTVLITSHELLDTEKTFIVAYKMNGYEIPETPLKGRTYWPLKLTGSAIGNYGRNIEEITNITIEFPPDVKRIDITSDSVITFAGGSSIQFAATAYDSGDIMIKNIPFTWSVSDSSIGTIDSDGLFTPLKAGNVNVTATYKYVTGSVAVEVLENSGTRIWTVDQSGNGDFLTIPGAVNYSRDGDTIIVHDGIYKNGQFVIDKGITLKSVNGYESTVIEDHSTDGFLIAVTANNVKISGFNLSGKPKASEADDGTLLFSGVNNCVVSENLFPSMKGIIGSSLSDSVIENNRFVDYGYLNLDGVNNNIVIRSNVLDSSYSKAFEILGSGSDIVIFNNSIRTSSTSTGAKALSFGGYENISIYNNAIDFGIGIYVGDFLKSAKIYNNTINCLKWGIDLTSYSVQPVQDKVSVQISGNKICVTKSLSTAYSIYLTSPSGDISIHHNELSSNGKYVTSMKNTTSYLNFYANNISIGSSNTNGLLKYDLPTLNSTVQYTYEYHGGTFTDFIGNSYNIYSGFDTNGDGLGETPFEEDGVYDYHPLTGTYSDYRIISEGKVAPESQNTTLNFKGLGVKTGAGGKQTATVNTTLTETTQNGSNVTISRANYDLVIEYDSDMAVTGDQITGTVKSVQLKTENLMKCNCSAGNVSGSLVVKLNDIPDGAGVDSSLMDGATADQNAAFQLAASGDGLKVDAVACTLTVVRQNLANGNDVASATIRLSADKTWVDAHGGNDSIKIIRCAEDGTKEILDTKSIAFDGVMETFEAVSPNGLSVFGLSATSTASAPSSATSTVSSFSSSSGGGGSSSIGTARIDSIGAGKTGVFTLGETAISSVELLASTEIPEMMLTSEKVSKPSGIDAAPGEVYQYIQINEYLAPEGSMKMATLKFSVDKEWLSSASGVKMYRYDEDSESWVMLSTVANGETDSGYKFFADTPSFSLFAITAEKGAASSSAVSSGINPSYLEPDSGISSGPQTSVEQTVQTETPAKASGFSPVFAVIAVFAIIAVCGVVYRFRKPENK